MKTILDYTKDELGKMISPSFRAKQIYQWIYQKYVESFDEMKNLPKTMREELKKEYIITPLEIANIEISKDGSKKYLFEVAGNLSIESVLLPMKSAKKDENGILDLVFEAYPISFIVELCGGESIDGEKRILDIELDGDIFKKSPIYFGSTYEIGKVKQNNE